MRMTLLVAASAVALLAACGAEDKKPVTPAAPAPVADAAPTKPKLGAWGIDLTNRDMAVTPGDDFFRHANGTWLTNFKLPADKARFGAFDELADKSESDVKSIIDGFAAAPPAAGSNAAKAADIYNSWMDEAALEKRGIEPLKPYLAKIDAVKTKADLVTLLASLEFSAPFGLGMEASVSDPTKYSIWASQGGLGMPDRDYYLKPDANFAKAREAYKTFVTKIFELLGDKDAAKSADAVIKFETEAAKGHWTQDQLRKPDDAFKTVSVEDFKKATPGIDWDKFAADLGLPKLEGSVVAYGDTAVYKSVKLLDTQSIDVWKKYLTFHIAADNATSLTKAFDDAQFDFYGKTLRGVTTQRDRWKRGVAMLDQNIGEALGEAYAAKFFPPANKKAVQDLVANLRSALESRIKALDWMDEPTRAAALKKLSTFEPRLGYPDHWRDYSAMVTDKTKLFENLISARKFEFQRQVARFHNPVDRTEWDMNAQTINANYNPLKNQITFPAGIMQPPFFDVNADLAVNYGAIGAVIGHEIGHGFDDEGSAFDETGKKRDWWTASTKKKFNALTSMLGAQYDKYCPVPSQPTKCVKGSQMMGENIGDLGGLNMAYTAYHVALGGKEAPVIDGLTGDQRFFLAWAQVWRATATDAFLLDRLTTDVHSPAEFRVNGVVRNMDAWYTAFNVKPTDKLYLAPDKRVKIW